MKLLARNGKSSGFHAYLTGEAISARRARSLAPDDMIAERIGLTPNAVRENPGTL
jgi:hypothetical protein